MNWWSAARWHIFTSAHEHLCLIYCTCILRQNCFTCAPERNSLVHLSVICCLLASVHACTLAQVQNNCTWTCALFHLHTLAIVIEEFHVLTKKITCALFSGLLLTGN